MNRKIIFMCTTLGYLKRFIATQTEDIFKITEDESRLYFNVGNIVGIESEDHTFDLVKEKIDDHGKMFPGKTFIYYGWLVTEFIHKLKKEYPTANFYGIRIADEFSEAVIDDWVSNSYDVKRDRELITARLTKQNDTLDTIYNSNIARIDIDRTIKARKCFHFYE